MLLNRHSFHRPLHRFAKKPKISVQAGLLIATALLLSTCSNRADEETEWIEVPLSAQTYFEEQSGFRSDEVEIPVFANSDLEYMLNLEQGGSVIYRWEAVDLNDPQKLLVEFHGHTIRTNEEPGDVMFYKQGRGGSRNGALIAPFDGVHGWYISNETNQDIRVVMSIAGYYDLP